MFLLYKIFPTTKPLTCFHRKRCSILTCLSTLYKLFNFPSLPETIGMTSQKALEFRFTGPFPDIAEITNVSAGFTEFHSALLSRGCNPKFATLEWVKNHYRWVVWKLACMERY